MADSFLAKYENDPRSLLKSKARLIQEANKIKKTLSANKNTQVFLSSLVNNTDFEIKIERSLIDDFLSKNSKSFLQPIRSLLEKSNKTIENIDFIEVVGGVTRIPGLQKLISDNFKETSTHLNGDEAMASGAAIFAANFSSEVQIRQIWLNDLYPFRVKSLIKSIASGYTREKEIFYENSPLNSVKKISFSSSEDLEVLLYNKYDDKYTETVNYRVKDIQMFAQKYNQSLTIVLTFVIDKNGIVELIGAEGRVEIEIPVEESIEETLSQDQKESNDTDFNQQVSNETYDKITENNETRQPDDESHETKLAESKNSDDNKELLQENNEKTAENDKNNTTPHNSTDDHLMKNSKNSKKSRTVLRKTQQKLKLSIIESFLESPDLLSISQISEIQRTLEFFTTQESEEKLRVELKNDLESFIYDIKEKLQNPEFLRVIPPTEQKSLESLLESTIK